MTFVMTNPAGPAVRRLQSSHSPVSVVASTEGDGVSRTAGIGHSIALSNGMPDGRLVERAAAGDVAAFGHLVQRYQRQMGALVSRMTDSPDDVDDIVQDVFLRAWKGLPRFRGDAQFSTWIYRIAVNTALKHRSRRRGEMLISISAEDLARGVESLVAPSDAAAERGADPMLAAIQRERDTQIQAAVRRLPPKQRTVVVLHYFEGLSCEEISRIADCSLGTVWSRLHYACKRLKGVLEAADQSK